MVRFRNFSEDQLLFNLLRCTNPTNIKSSILIASNTEKDFHELARKMSSRLQVYRA